MALSGAFGNGLWGALAERFSARTLSVATTLLSAASVALLMQVDSPPLAYLFGLIFGISARGGTAVLAQIFLAHLFRPRLFRAGRGPLQPFHKGGLWLCAVPAGCGLALFCCSYPPVFWF